MRLIDADALMQSLGITNIDCDKCAWHDKEWSRCKRGGDFEDACCAIENAPTIEPQRKTGKWIYNSPVTMKCNQCGLVIKDWDWHRFKYCPNCGAALAKTYIEQ